MNYKKYQKQYFVPEEPCMDWAGKESVTETPIWCSVDLRDGNQALIETMGVAEKIRYFEMLTKIGFSQIELGSPADADSDFQFIRKLAEEKLIPENVTVQVFTRTDSASVERTLEAVEGIEHVIFHIVHPVSKVLCEQIMGMSEQEILEEAVSGVRNVVLKVHEHEGNADARITYEFSPEGFAGNDQKFVLTLLNAVLDEFAPDENHKVIINLPATVEFSMPHVFASQVEYFHRHLKYREHVILSVHPHNDRGSAVSDAEFGLLAGARRVEGTLFGNGERTGNADIVTLALNLLTHGIDPELDFSDLPAIKENFERLTSLEVPKRQPYAGELVFSAFMAKHQDAITKGMKYRAEQIAASSDHTELPSAHKAAALSTVARDQSGNTAEDSSVSADSVCKWEIPYLPVDPEDLGRTYDADVIRINSRSGKNGIAYVLKQQYGISMPEAMKDDVGAMMKNISDMEQRELSPDLIYRLFEDTYIHNTEYFSIPEAHYRQLDDGILAEVTIRKNEEDHKVTANGNGRLSAVSNAVKQYFDLSYELTFYEERSLSKGSSSKAITFVGISFHDKLHWGVGIHEDIVVASTNALAAAVNQLPDISNAENCKDERILEIQNYIQMNYLTVTLDELSEHFYLSKPYLSKYIREKSGITFGETVKKVRMRKAKTLLKNRNMTVESIAENVGYQNVEHFNRLFKKAYGITPIQFRNQK